MPDDKVPGAYVQEGGTQPPSITGVSVSTAAFLGFAESGPFDPVLITSFREYQSTFGGFPENGFLPFAVDGFFANGGARCYVLRVPPEMRAGAVASGSLLMPAFGADVGIEGLQQLSDLESIAAMAPELLQSLAAKIDVGVICCPDEHEISGIAAALVQDCEKRRDRMVILQAPRTPIPEKGPPAKLQSSYAAYYWPWLKVTGPDGKSTVAVPPGGHLAGAYALNDAERGVAKAPENLALLGVTVLDHNLTDQQQGALNQLGVNIIREFPGQGILIWGGRTTSQDPEWKYVNLRRYLIYLERSIDEGLQWVVFEPNGERLWASVRSSITNFLLNEWKSGALQGITADQAFFVKCDRTTMTQNDFDNGRLVVVVGVALLKPAEFAITQIGLWTADANKPAP